MSQWRKGYFIAVEVWKWHTFAPCVINGKNILAELACSNFENWKSLEVKSDVVFFSKSLKVP